LHEVQRCELSGAARLAERQLATKTTLKRTPEILPYPQFDPSALMAGWLLITLGGLLRENLS